MTLRYFRSLAGAALLAASSLFVRAQTPAAPRSSADILQELLSFRTTGTVLLVAAHPDDEDTQLIAYFARGRGYRTGYLSMNRGEGGQNLIGPEFGDELGVIRTQELLAARKVDGAVQFFTRARDFGYSKSSADTLRRWDHQKILADVVRVIRTFQPDVLITRFSPQPGTTHGHHTASAILTLEAFKVVGQAERVDGLEPWQPKRVLWDAFRPGFVAGLPSGQPGLRLDVGGYNPVLGLSYGEIAALSRSNHRTQGFGSVGSRGSRFVGFQLLAGEPARADAFDGIDTTWNRFGPDGAEIGRLTDAIIAAFDPKDPSKSVPALLEVRTRLANLREAKSKAANRPAPPALLTERSAQLDRILQSCLGLYIETTAANAEVVPGERMELKQTVVVRSGIPVEFTPPAAPAGSEATSAAAVRPPRALKRNEPASFEVAFRMAPSLQPSQPYWLQQESTPGRFEVSDPSFIGMPQNPPACSLNAVFTIEGQTILIPSPVMQVYGDPAKGEVRRPLQIIPPVYLALSDDIALIAPSGSQTVSVDVTAARAGVAGLLRLGSPASSAAGWTVAPAEQAIRLPLAGQTQRFSFTVTAPPALGSADLSATAEINGAFYSNRRIELHYDHIPTQLLQPAARLRAISLDLKIRARRVGYLPGAGDDISAALTRMGCAVTTLSGADLTADSLRSFDAVVIGIRAFNVRSDLAAHLDGLFAYVFEGGTVVAQYNTPGHLKSSRLAPYPLALDSDLPANRVTNESGPVTLLAPGHPALVGPNAIGPADFTGWVQERGLNFPSEWDSHFVPLLACADIGENPLTSGLLIARYGKGYYVYTGLSFFRELPAGVPGAYRLFANLISLGR